MAKFNRCIYTVPIADVAAINARLEKAKHPTRGYGYGPDNVCLRLSDTGEEPATHGAADSNLDDAMRSQVEGLRLAYPSIEVYATWAEVEAAGLKRIVSKSTIGGK